MFPVSIALEFPFDFDFALFWLVKRIFQAGGIFKSLLYFSDFVK
jgi:hypothetical protein